MRIAIVNTTAYSGSIGKIANGLREKLKNDGHETKLFYGRNDSSRDSDVTKIVNNVGVYLHALFARITGLHGYFSYFRTKKLIQELKKYNPDVVQLYNLHGYYLCINTLFDYLRDNNITTVYSMLDEHPYLGRCCYSYDCEQFKNGCAKCGLSRKEYPQTWWFKWSKKYVKDKEKAYSYDNICFVAPEWVINRAKTSYLLNDKRMYVVDEFIDTGKTFLPKTDYVYIDKRILNTEKIVVLTVAPYTNTRKGGKYFIELAQHYCNSEKYMFIYVGMNDDNVDIPKNCIVKGFISNQNELAEYYSIADLFVCTSLADTMPNVCLDALACGTPVLGFNISGTPYVADNTCGTFVTAESVEELSSEVGKISKKDSQVIGKCREYALSRYSPDVYYKKMMNIYREMIALKGNDK